MKLFGVVAECSEGGKPHSHLVAVGKDYFEAWGSVPPEVSAIDRDADLGPGPLPKGETRLITVRVGANAKAVRELRRRKRDA